MARETTIRTLSANELENVIGGTRPLIRFYPPTDASGATGAYREFQSDEAEGAKG
jgi:bacteriocin-like protein